MSTLDDNSPNFDTYLPQPKTPKVVFVIVFVLLLLTTPLIGYAVKTGLEWRSRANQSAPPLTITDSRSNEIPGTEILTETVATDSAATQSGQMQAAESATPSGSQQICATPAPVSNVVIRCPNCTEKE